MRLHPLSSQPFDLIACPREGCGRVDTSRKLPGPNGHEPIVQQGADGGRGWYCAISSARQRAAQAEPRDPPTVVELIMAAWHHQLRNAGLDRLPKSADASVMDDQRRARQHLAEWQITERLYYAGQRG